MKGKVLGFDPAAGTGMINGENGSRYAFTASDNKSPNPPRAGDDVDFVADGANAKDIFVVMAAPAAAPASIDLSKLASDPNVKNILAKPYVIWAAVIILGSLIAGYFNALGALNSMSGPMGTGLGISAIFIMLLFFVPVVAGVLIFFEFTNHKMTAQFRMITAAVAIGGPILLPILAGLLAPEMYKQAMEMAAAFGGGGSYGFIGFGISPGMIITVAGGVLIVLTHMGIVKLPKA